jgi:hypothetical protein
MPKLNFFIAILFFSLIFQIFSAETIIEQNKTIEQMQTSFWKSMDEGYYLLNDNIIPKGHTVIAFSSLNNTGYTDIITYVNDSNSFIFYRHLYDKEKYEFTFDKEKDKLFEIKNENISSVRNLFVGKLFGDSVCYLASFNHAKSENELLHYIKCGSENPTLMNIKSNILILNRDSQNRGQILFSVEKTLKICLLESSNHYCESGTNIVDFKNVKNDKKNIEISLKGGMAYVDVDGNCSPDILLSHEKDGKLYINVYLSNRKTEGTYEFAQEIEVGNTADFGPFVISRINNTKNSSYAPLFDILIPMKNESKILVYENSLKLTYSWETYFCDDNSYEDVDVSIIGEIFKKKENHTYDLPLPDVPNVHLDNSSLAIIRPGDFLAEGRPGLLVKQKSGDNTYLSLYSKDAYEFILQLTVNSSKIGNVKNGVFYDINESGLLSLIVQNDKLENFFILNYRKNTYFVKSKLMNDKKAYYDANLGASFRYIVTDRDGSRHMDLWYQLAQTSDMNIPLPYSLIGIGETNNYIENFQILSGNYYKDLSMFKDSSKRNFKDQTPIIPNTQMVIFKFLNDASKYEWYIDLIVLPMDSLVVIALVIVGVMLAILGVIIYLHIREVKEEQKETNKFKSWFA